MAGGLVRAACPCLHCTRPLELVPIAPSDLVVVVEDLLALALRDSAEAQKCHADALPRVHEVAIESTPES